MAKPNYAGLVQIFEAAEREKKSVDEAVRLVHEAVVAKDFDAKDFDFGKLWAQCFGWNEFHHCRSTGKLAREVMEAAGPTMTNAFQGISGQAFYGMILPDYNAPEFKFTKLIPVEKCEVQFEKVPGVAEIGDEVAIVKEGDLYPVVGLSEKYRHRPVLRKRGFRIQLTREVLFFDKTGDVQKKASGGAKWMGTNREKRAVDTIIDENAGAVSALLGGHRYHYFGNSISTYGNNSGNHDFDNLSATNAIVDWTDLETAEVLFDGITDPVTSEPIVFEPKHLICATTNKQTAMRIRNATEINVVTPGFATTGNPTETKVGNPYANKFEVISSPYVANRLATDTDWFYGDVGMAFEFCEAWAEEVKQLASGTQLEFDADIVWQGRFSHFGEFSTKEPRAIGKSTAA